MNYDPSSKTPLSGTDGLFLQSVSELQNAGPPNISQYPERNRSTMIRLSKALNSRETDLILNTGAIFEGNLFKKIQTFDPKEYCAMIPRKLNEDAKIFIIMGFNIVVWIWLALAVALSTILWRLINRYNLTKSNNGVGDFLFFIFGLFLGHYPTLRHLSFTQKILSGIFVFATMVISTMFTPNLLSTMVDRRDSEEIVTIDELTKSSFPIYTYQLTKNLIVNADSHEGLGRKLKEIQIFSLNEFNQNKSVFIASCKRIEYELYFNETNSNLSNNFYIMKEKLFLSYHSYTVSYFSPLYEKLNFYSTAVFESGLRKYWKIAFPPYIKQFNSRYRLSNEPAFLPIEFEDFKLILTVWMIGIVCCLAVFVSEILIKKFSKPCKAFEESFDRKRVKFGRNINFMEVAKERRWSCTDVDWIKKQEKRDILKVQTKKRRNTAPIIRRFEDFGEMVNARIVYF